MTKSNTASDDLYDGPAKSRTTVILAHGAGAAMDTDFMNVFAAGIAAAGFRVVRFEFPYMAARRLTGKRSPPNREPILRETWHDVIRVHPTKRLIVGGKSMGGRIASMIADEANAAGLVCLGYPFHPTGKPEKLRTEHLRELRTPALILQGERDPMGQAAEVATYQLSNEIRLHWLTDGDHSFKPRKAAGRSLDDNMTEAIQAFVDFFGPA